MGRGREIYIPPEIRRERRSTVTVEGTPNQPPSIQLPVARIGIPIPYIIGRQRVFQPNIIWYGNLQPVVDVTREVETQTYEVRREDAVGLFEYIDTVTVDTVTETRNVIGYTVDMQIGICLGDGVHLRAIYVDNAEVWTGDVGPARTEFNVSSNTFINGDVIFAGGEYDQAPDPYLAGFITDLPGYVGTANLIIKGIDVSAALGQLSFEVERFPNPLGLSGAENRIGDDLNVASALAEIMTNPWGAGGIDISAIDTATFTAAAATLASESNACSLIVQTENNLPRVLNILLDQAQAQAYENPADAQVELRLIRPQDFDFADVTQFGETDITDVQRFDKTSWAETVEQLRGEYTSRASGYTTEPVMAQNVATLPSSGRGKRTESVDYPAVMVESLAQDLVTRDIGNISQPIYNINLLVNRKAADLLPGDLVLVNWSKYQLLNVLCVVLRKRAMPLDQNEVVLELQQLILGDPTVTFAPPETPLAVPVTSDPVAPTAVAFKTAPFWAARRAGTGISPAFEYDFVYPIILASPANSVQSTFTALVTNVPNALGDVSVIPSRAGNALVSDSKIYGAFPTLARLTAGIGQFDAATNGIIGSVTIDGVVNNKYLLSIGNTGVRDGTLLMFVNDEILSFETATDLGGNSWRLDNVHRALLDTVSEAHADNDFVFIMPSSLSNMPRGSFDLPLSYTPAWSIISNSPTTLGNKTQHSIASSAWTESIKRLNLPLRPHNTKIAGNPRSSSAVDLEAGRVYNITWATRSRNTAPVSLQLDAAEESEIDVSGDRQIHRVLVEDSAVTLHDLGATSDTADANDLTVTIPAGAALGAGTLYVRAETVFGNSLLNDVLPINIVAPGAGVGAGGSPLAKEP